MKIDLILMAAGNSRRFGSNKLLYEWRGKKLYRYMLDALLEAAEGLPQVRVRVVTQYEEILKMAEELAKREAPGFLTGVYSPESVKGLSYTIRKALDFEAADPPEAFAFFTADTPGFSSFDITKMERIKKEDLQQCFPEFEPYWNQCRFASCAHIKEPDCVISAAVEKGEIAPSRYESYVRL